MQNLYGFLLALGLLLAVGAQLTAKGRVVLLALAGVAFGVAALDAWLGLT